MNKAVRDYFRKIGRKGGKAGKGKRHEDAKKAAHARWRKQHPKPAEISA